MELSLQEFLESVQNPNTKKEYRYGIKKFYEWFSKSAKERGICGVCDCWNCVQ